MLIKNTTKMNWNPSNKRIYEEKGYTYTKMNDAFEVKIKDLTKGSNVKVDVKCDCEDCKNPYLNPMWIDYLKHVHNDGKYYCSKCALKLYGNENRSNVILENGKSFQEWCVENNRQDVLDRWDYKLNSKSPLNITYSNNNKYYFKCHKETHSSELKRVSDFTSGKEGSILCNQCNSIGQWGVDNLGIDFLEKYWDYEKNNVNPYDINYGSKTPKIWIKCQEKDYHVSYDISCNSFSKGRKCGLCSCANGRVHILDSLGTLFPKSLEMWSNKNNNTPFNYSTMNNQKVWWKCECGKHEDYKRTISSALIRDFRCIECVRERDESLLQEKVRLYLSELGYTLFHENKCTIVPINPKTKHRLPFDNEVKELSIICEVMGIQHYKLNPWHKMLAERFATTPEYELHMQQVRDRYKKFIAYKQGYEYIAIPYYTDDKKETWKKLIDDKIKENKLKEAV